jgi:two-component system, NtrC family, sensor kinase
MQLSLKISVTTAFAICGGLLGYGYLLTEREVELVRSDLLRDHQTLGHGLALAASAVAERSGPDRARLIIEDVNLRRSGIDIRWEPSDAVSPTAEPTPLAMTQLHDAARHSLTTRVPVALGGEAGYLALDESTVENDRYIHGSVVRSIAATVGVTLWSACVIFALGWWLLGRPLKLLVERARHIGGGDFESRLYLEQRDEIGELAGEINAMCDRLRAAQVLAMREGALRIAAIEQLRHADRLTTVGKLASGIAHELGTPLNVVAARARMIATGESSGSSVARDAATIAGQAERMASIISQLLDFARQRRACKAKHDMCALLRGTLDLLGPLGSRSGVQLRFTGVHPAVHAMVDGSQVQQVMTNLIVNAVQAQPGGGEVRASVSELESDDSVALVVEDDGQGMEPAVAERMFEPFFTTKDVGGGTGLGLAVVHGIVEEHGGRFSIDTRIGGGTRICVLLPKGTLA